MTGSWSVFSVQPATVPAPVDKVTGSLLPRPIRTATEFVRVFPPPFPYPVLVTNDIHAPLVEVVPASRSELPGIAALAAVIWRQHYPGIITDTQIDYMLERMYSLARMEEDMVEGIRYDRLLVDGELAGFSAHGSADEPATGKLHKLYVDPHRHGRGLGWRLLQAAEDRARAEGWTTLLLQVNKRNEKAIAFYRRAGFEVRESATFDIGDGYVMDDFIMGKALRNSC